MKKNRQQARKKAIKKLKDWQINQTESYKTYIKTSAVGLEVGLSIAVGALIGYWLDGYLASSPYALVIGLIVGSIAAAKRLWVFVKSYVAKDNSDKKS